MTVEKECLFCGKAFEAKRVTGKYCSSRCCQKYLNGSDKERACRNCGKVFPIISFGDNNRRHCSQACAKQYNSKYSERWHEQHPDAMKQYNKNRIFKNPGAWIDQKRNERIQSIALLGGKCIVCGASNPNWLHVDYIPTTRGKPYRHPRHLKYIREHLDEFRLLCANHHYELTLTGHIEGTGIFQ